MMAVFKPAVHIQENLLPLPAESVHNWWEQAPVRRLVSQTAKIGELVLSAGVVC